MKYPETENIKIKNFFDACNEMIQGRFILSDIKISKILKAIANSEVLYNLFAKVLTDFKFKEEFENAKTNTKVNGGYFALPEDKERAVALVFCLLLEVDNQKMNLQNFVNDYFYSPEGYNISYSNFALSVLVPFKENVLELLGCDEQGSPIETEEEPEEVETQVPVSEPNHKKKILFANLTKSLNELLSVIRRSRISSEEKEELEIIIGAIYEAVEIENLNIINALVIPLEHMIGRNKQVKFYYNDFKESLIQFYYL